MTKCILFTLLLSCCAIPIATAGTCTTCTEDLTATTLSRAEAVQLLLAHDWQTPTGKTWRFLANGHAIATVPGQASATVANWSFSTTTDNFHVEAITATTTHHFVLPIAYGEVTLTETNTCLQPVSGTSARTATLSGQWRASLGRDAGTQTLELHTDGTYTLSSYLQGTTTTDYGQWSLCPNDAVLVLFSAGDADVRKMAIPYLELDELVLQPTGGADSFFYNRL